MTFQYLLNKIAQEPFRTSPFKHVEIIDFLTAEHFHEIVHSPQVNLRCFQDDIDLVGGLQQAGYQAIPFPGTTDDIRVYLAWHTGQEVHPVVDTCEGFGMTFRLKAITSPILIELTDFLTSPAFLQCVADKFSIALDSITADTGLQKYLDGYEISPHPDVRRKALTYMVNINPDAQSHTRNFHTHYMRFRPTRKYIQTYWQHNPESDRCWVPWDWCETEKQQTRNNSLVMFSPADDTLHAVRAHYDHLTTQRTQLYGNLWYKAEPTCSKPQWRDFVITPTAARSNETRRPAASE